MNLLDVLNALMTAGSLAFMFYGLWLCLTEVGAGLIALLKPSVRRAVRRGWIGA
jgi:hypothetical protein